MYTGSTLICGGMALAVAAPASASWALPVVALIHRIRLEEQMLHDALGSRYASYAHGRARLIPTIW